MAISKGWSKATNVVCFDADTKDNNEVPRIVATAAGVSMAKVSRMPSTAAKRKYIWPKFCFRLR